MGLIISGTVAAGVDDSTSDDLGQTILDNAQGPAEARGDQGSMRQHGLRDQIAASRFLAENDALNDTTKPTLGIRLAILKPPGAV